MSVTQEQIIAFLANNPTAAETQAAMAQYGVSPTQVASALQSMYADQGATETVQTGSGEQPQTVTQDIDYGGGFRAWENAPQIIGVSGEGENQTPIYAAPTLGGFTQQVGDKLYVYDTQGNLQRTQSTQQSIGQQIAPFAQLAAPFIAPGISDAIAGATGLTGGALSAATGAAMGGGAAALTGNDILKGALLGGGAGYLSSLINSGVTDTDLLQQAADADLAGGMLPEYGTNAAYDAAMADLMANSHGAIAQLENIVNSQVGGTLGPDNIDVGGGWSPADTTDYSMEVTADSPVTDYSNEGRNYPTTQSTQGTGGSPINASTAAGALTLEKIKDLLGSTSATTGLSSLPAFVGALGVLKGLVGDGSNTTVPTYAAPSQDTRTLPQWDWNAISAQAAQQGLAPGQFVARNLPQAMSGAYNQAAPVQKSRGGALNALAHGGGSGRDDTIDAKLSDGEYVMDAETVALLGDGSTNAGARRLDDMRAKIREHKGKSMARGKFSANAKSPLAYLKASS